MKKTKNGFLNFSLLGIGLCAICCALPLIGAVVGGGTLVMLAQYFEWAGFAALALAIVLLLNHYIKRRRVKSCATDCDCKTKDVAVGEN